MKIAYLILAHKRPGQFKRLVKTLNSETTQIFVHIDSRVDINQFQSVDTQHAIFLQDRMAPNWGGYSLLLTMLHVLRTAMAAGDFDYFQFLSGLDYPIKTDQEITQFYENAAGNSYLFSYPLVPGAPKAETFRRYYFVDQIAQLPKGLHAAAHKFESLVSHILPDRTLNGYKPHRGSQWICLHRDAAEYCMAYLQTPKGKQFLDFFKYSWGSDEIMFPILLLNSALAARIQFDPYENDHANYAENMFALHYIDWNRNRERPAIFEDYDFDALKASKALFARKFNLEKSSALLARIDLELRQVGAPTA